MKINYERIPSGKVRSIILKAEKVAQSLHEDGRHQQAVAIEDLIRSRIASQSENSQINKLYRQALGSPGQSAVHNPVPSKEKPAPEDNSGAGSSHQSLERTS